MVCSILFTLALGASAALGAPKETVNPYAPYAFLIGEWNVGAPGGKAMAVARFRWGPERSYIWYSVSLLEKDSEQPHMEGLLMWNGVRRNLDMLMTIDLKGGRAQEQGVVFVENDGTVVRDITAYYSAGAGPEGAAAAGPEGATARFRQTFKPVGTDEVATALTRETGAGWVATFAGSERLVMRRRPEMKRLPPT